MCDEISILVVNRYIHTLLMGQVGLIPRTFVCTRQHVQTECPLPKSSHRSVAAQHEICVRFHYNQSVVVLVYLYLCDNVNEAGCRWLPENVYVDTNQCLDINVTVKSIMTLLFPVLIVSV